MYVERLRFAGDGIVLNQTVTCEVGLKRSNLE